MIRPNTDDRDVARQSDARLAAPGRPAAMWDSVLWDSVLRDASRRSAVHRHAANGPLPRVRSARWIVPAVCACVLVVALTGDGLLAARAGMRTLAAAAPSAGTWICHDPGFPDPCHRAINAADMASESLGWAVGDMGVIMRWDGRRWSVAGSPTRSDLHAIDVVSDREAWAVGDDSAILRFDGSGWSLVPYDRGRPLYGVHALASDDVWMVGAAGFVLHWDGAGFAVHSTGVTDDLHAVRMVPASDGTAGGQAPGGTETVAVPGAVTGAGSRASTRSGIGAETDTGVVKGAITGTRTGSGTGSGTVAATVAGIAVGAGQAIDGWAAGGYSLLRWDVGSQQWREAPQPPDTRHDLRDIELAGPDSGWAAGRTILRLTDGEWREAVSARDVDGLLLDVELTAGDAGWAVGGARTWRLAGSQWTVFDDTAEDDWQYSAVATVDGAATGSGATGGMGAGTDADAAGGTGVGAVTGAAAGRAADGWVFGSSSDGALEMRRWNDSEGTWTVEARHDPQYGRAVAVVSATDAWRSTISGGLEHWDGETWTPTGALDGAVEGFWWDIDALSADVAWAVSFEQVLRWDGRYWADTSAPLGLLGVAAVSENEAWAVGASGRIAHWSGEAWTEFDSPTVWRLWAVSATGPDDVWAVGEAGTALHWDGAVWSKVETPTTDELYDVKAVGPDAAWAVGFDGASGDDAILRWDGEAWRAESAPGRVPLYLGAVAANDASDVWAVGGHGVMVHWDGTAWSWHPAPTMSAIVDIDLAGGGGWTGGAEYLRYLPPPGPTALFVPVAFVER